MGIEIIIFNAIIGAAISGGTSFVFGRLFAKKQKPPAPSPVPVAQAPDPLSDYHESGGALPGLFGHRRIAGKALFQGRYNNATYLVYVIAGAPVTGIDAVYINDSLVTIDGSGNVTSEPWANTGTYSMQVWLYDGTQTVVDPTLNAALPGWKSTFRGEKIAYAVVKINPAVNSTKFASTYNAGIPTFAFHVRGFKCYDPRDGGCVLGNDSTYIFSANASVIEANYLIHQLGMNLPTAAVDWDSVEAAADIDDENVTLKSGGVERRYTACLYWMTDETHDVVLGRIGAAHAGGARPFAKAYQMMTGALPGSSTAIVVDDYSGDGLTVTEKVPISGRVNGVRGRFTSPADAYEMRDFPAYQDTAALAEDGGREEWLELQLDCVTSHTQAQRLARIAYWRARYGYQASLTLNLKHFDITADDLVSITDAMADLSAATFRVQEDMLNENSEVELDLTRETSAAFAWTAASDEQDYTAGEAIVGEQGDWRLPGGALTDAAGGTIIPQIVIWPSPTVIADADHYRMRDNGTISRWTGAMTSTISANVTAVNAASSIAGNWNLAIEDAANNVLISANIVVPGGTVGAALNGLDATATPYFTHNAPRAPLLSSLSNGNASILAPVEPTLTRVSHIRLYLNTSNDSGSASLADSQAPSGSGNTFAVTGTPGSIAWYWTRLYDSVTGQEGPFSRPLMIVF